MSNNAFISIHILKKYLLTYFINIYIFNYIKFIIIFIVSICFNIALFIPLSTIIVIIYTIIVKNTVYFCLNYGFERATQNQFRTPESVILFLFAPERRKKMAWSKAPGQRVIQRDGRDYIMPPIPPIPPPGGMWGMSSLSFGLSAIIASVVKRRAATDEAF